jgi:hypothetical protein
MIAVVALATQANAAITLATETFSYPDGALVPNGGWANQSGTAGTLLVASGAAVVTQNSGSEDAELVFANNLTVGVVTATFDINVTAPGAMTGTGFEYFAHFSDDTTFAFTSRLDVVTPSAGGDYTLGISSTTSTAEDTLPTDFSFGTVVPVSISFDLNTGTGSLTAGGNTVSGSALGAGEIIDAFNLRQANSTSDETITVDNLVVTYVPEPASIALVALGALALAGLGRRSGR